MHMKRFAAALLVATTLAQPARALVVFDPTNFSANLQQMLSQLESAMHDITMISNQVTQIEHLARSVENGNFTNLPSILSFIDQTVEIAERADGIASNLVPLEDMYRSTYEVNWDAQSARGGAGQAPAPGTTITWNDGTTSTVKGDGTDQNGYQIAWSDGSNTYVRQPTASTFAQQTHNAVRQALAIQQGVQAATIGHRGALSGAMGASQRAVGAVSAVQASNELLGLLSNQMSAQTQVLSAHARVVESDTAGRVSREQRGEAASRYWLRSTPRPAVEDNAIRAQFGN